MKIIEFKPDPGKYQFDDIINPIFWESKEDEDIRSFIDYSAEHGDAPYAAVDEKSISIIWKEKPGDPARKHVCTISPSTGTAIFQPFKGDISSFELSEELLDKINRASRNWGLSVTPFKSRKAANKKSLTIATITINGNPEAEQVKMPSSLFASFTDADNRGFSLNANYMKTNSIKGTIFYEKEFITPEEAVIDLIKTSIGLVNAGYEVEFYDGDNKDIKYSREDMEQLVFQYSQKISPSDTNVLQLPVYNPTDEKDVRTYTQAVKKGDLALVKQFLSAGAEPIDFYLRTSSKKRKIEVFETAVDAGHKEVAKALLEHYIATGNTAAGWMYESIEEL